VVEWILVTIKKDSEKRKSVEYYAIGGVVFWLIIFNWILYNKNKPFDDTTQHYGSWRVKFLVKKLLMKIAETIE
jgi:hypothetical protein